MSLTYSNRVCARDIFGDSYMFILILRYVGEDECLVYSSIIS